MLMQNLGGQTKSIMVFFEVAYERVLHTVTVQSRLLSSKTFLKSGVLRFLFSFRIYLNISRYIDDKIT